MNKGYLKIDSLADVDFRLMLNDYIDNFTRQYLIIKTNYKKISEIKVVFSKYDLYHLLGLHKVQNQNKSATKSLGKIATGELNLNSVRTHPNFNEIRNQLLNYNFLHHCFLDHSVHLCIIVNSKPNPQKLSVVFIDRVNDRNVLLGLKEARGQNYYVPATLYEMNDSSVYNTKRRTNIKSMEWHNYN